MSEYIFDKNELDRGLVRSGLIEASLSAVALVMREEWEPCHL